MLELNLNDKDEMEQKQGLKRIAPSIHKVMANIFNRFIQYLFTLNDDELKEFAAEGKYEFNKLKQMKKDFKKSSTN
jgi:hypothetical protein